MILRYALRALNLTVPETRTDCATRAHLAFVRLLSGIVYQLIYISETVLHRLKKTTVKPSYNKIALSHKMTGLISQYP